jgi:hypothetical protein
MCFQRYEIVNGITEVEDDKVDEKETTETNESGKAYENIHLASTFQIGTLDIKSF